MRIPPGAPIGNKMTKTQIDDRIKILRAELENRYKFGVVKLADNNGQPISVEKLQNELYALIYKKSKINE